MWETEGKPMDTTVILALRQKIMKVLLEEHKIKTSTSSNELGRWQKQLQSDRNCLSAFSALTSSGSPSAIP